MSHSLILWNEGSDVLLYDQKFHPRGRGLNYLYGSYSKKRLGDVFIQFYSFAGKNLDFSSNPTIFLTTHSPHHFKLKIIATSIYFFHHVIRGFSRKFL